MLAKRARAAAPREPSTPSLRKAGGSVTRHSVSRPQPAPRTVNMVVQRATATEPTAPSLTVLRSHKSDILRVAKAHGTSNIRVFGSVARGTATPTSDVDLLVDFQYGRTLVDLVRLWRGVETLLGTGVDVSAGGLAERDDDIRADARPTEQSSRHRQDRR
ncbi:MAG: nucleotidyltransferase domain-containing protein [Acidimicrobiales bacterium]